MKTDEMRNAKLIYIPAWVTYLSTTATWQQKVVAALVEVLSEITFYHSTGQAAAVIERREFSAEKDVGEKCGSV